MKDRLRYVLAVLFAGVAGIMGGIVLRPSPSLHAQADPMCTCTLWQSTWKPSGQYVSIYVPCTGLSTLSTIPTCSSVAVGQYCVVSGTLNWVPDSPQNCQVNINNGGLIWPLGFSNAAYFYFDARTTPSPDPWFAYSTTTVCSASSDIGFGWRLSIASKYASGDQTTGCVCNAPDSWQLQGFEIWRCKPE